MDGLLIIDKPTGPTSHDVVARARRALREKRIGHTGTLDPLATGVLPLVIGKATRLASFLSSSEKEYEAAIRLGATSDTYDAAGTLSPGTSAELPAQGDIERALTGFHGTFDQMPPPFSAKKVGGVPAYKLARKQKPTALTAVSVTVHGLELLAIEPGLVRVRVRTSPGFYIRSLAHDLGTRLGCGAYLEALRRTRAGRYDLAASVPLDELEQDPEAASGKMLPLEALAPELPFVRVTARGAERTAHGNFLTPQDFAERMPLDFARPAAELALEAAPTGRVGPGRTGIQVRVLDGGGRLLAIAEAGADGVLRPSIVLV